MGNTHTVPGMTDHRALVATYRANMKTKRKTYQYGRANKEGLKIDLIQLQRNFTEEASERDVEGNSAFTKEQKCAQENYRNYA